MAPSAKTQYLGYHMVYDCEEGFDVPMSAFERQHHRERHRPAARPSAHGGERLSRHHARPRLLARCHSWPAGGEEEPAYGEEDEKRAPPLPSRYIVREAAAEEAPVPPLVDCPNKVPAAARDAAATWAAFTGRLVAEAPKVGGAQPQQWPRRGGGSPVASATPKGEAAAKATSAARGGITGAQHVEAADDRMVDAGTAKMAARLLPTLLKSASLEGEGRISVGRMKVLLESAVSLASLRVTPKKRVTASATAELAPAKGELPARDTADEEELEAFSASRDLRGKGWMKLHKIGRGAKKMEQVSFKSAQRLAQFDEAIGYFSADEQQLGKSWALYDKARSRQHGGNVRFKRAASGHYE